MENLGQWSGDFNFKIPLSNGAVFISGNKVVYHFGKFEIDSTKLKSQIPHSHFAEYSNYGPYAGHAYEVSFIAAKDDAEISTSQKRKTYQNYFLGKDASKWKNSVSLFGEIAFEDIYPGIDIRYFFDENENLKYDLVLERGADPKQIKLEYKGADKLKIVYGNLWVKTSVEDVLESAPIAFQIINGQRQEVKCKYVLEGNVLSYKLGKYNPNYELVIDPLLIFSTYTGSRVDNFGFTATYGVDGAAYGGGIAYNSNPLLSYPVSLGAYQDTFHGGTYDVVISKFSPDGSDLIYSTYLGGNGNEVPLSLIETYNKDLLILGTTGSANFPTTVQCYDSVFSGGTNVSFPGTSIVNYNNGADIFISKLDSTGGQLLGSSFFGGTGNDGVNSAFRFNYADENRSEIAIDSIGNIYIAATTNSKDISSSGLLSPSPFGFQDGIVASFKPDLKSLRWASYIAGSDHDAAMSLKVNGDHLYVAGITASSDLGISFNGGFEEQFLGIHDGFLLRMTSSAGMINAFTYNGTSKRDRNFLLDIDEDNNVYVFGHSMGSYPILGANVFFQARGNQYINKFNSDLSQSLKSMIFGNMDSSKTEVSPTAFMVDDCKNIYLSGYGRQGSSTQGPSNGLPITNNIDEVQGARSNSDGEDFYFMVLDASWEKVNFGAYFGEYQGPQGDHVDGGTSRFQKDGTIYQAVCASCGGTDNFPVSDSAYSRVNGSSNCNMAVLKLRMELDVKADFRPDLDSSCIPYTVNLSNRSYNADVYSAVLPDGSIMASAPDQIIIDQVGVQYLSILARDTTCGFEDSVKIRFYGYIDPLSADFSLEYDTCDAGLSVEFKNESIDANAFYWDFGDGVFSTDSNPVHQYSQEGTFTIQLIASGGICGSSDTTSQTISIRSSNLRGDFNFNYDPCNDGTEAYFYTQGGGFQQYIWSVDDQVLADSSQIKIDFLKPGTYEVKLESVDSVCNRVFTHRESITIIDFDPKIELPNVFSPNGDNQNDILQFINIPEPDYFSEFDLKIYNRWGSELFAASHNLEAWDGKFENKDVPQGVYYYVLNFSDRCGNKEERTGFFHLFR